MWYVALRNLWQRRLRSLLTMLGVAVAVQLYLTISSIIASYDLDLQAQLSAMGGRVFVQRPAADEGGLEEFPSPSSSIEAEVADELLELEGLDGAASSAILYVPLTRSPAPGLPPSTLALGIEPGHEEAFLADLDVESGQRALQGPDGVVLGRGAAEHYGAESGSPAACGDTIHILGRPFTVLGVLGRSPNLYRGVVMLDLSTAQELFNRRGTVSAVILAAARVDEVETIQAAVQERYPELEAADQEDIADDAREMLRTMDVFFDLINTTVVAVVFLFVTIVMFVAVMERRRDIGVLRAIGAGRIKVFRMVASESLLLSLGGVVLAWPIWALIGGLFIGEFASSSEVVLSGWLHMGLLAVVVGVGASLVPAWRAVQVDPLEALRYE
jgi:ABC-type lipoprotein release transport system permease subunit